MNTDIDPQQELMLFMKLETRRRGLINTEARIYVRGDRVVAYGRIMEIMSLVNSAGYVKVALVTQNPVQ